MHLSEGRLESDFPLITSENCAAELGMTGSDAAKHLAWVKDALKSAVAEATTENGELKVKHPPQDPVGQC